MNNACQTFLTEIFKLDISSFGFVNKFVISVRNVWQLNHSNLKYWDGQATINSVVYITLLLNEQFYWELHCLPSHQCFLDKLSGY